MYPIGMMFRKDILDWIKLSIRIILAILDKKGVVLDILSDFLKDWFITMFCVLIC